MSHSLPGAIINHRLLYPYHEFPALVEAASVEPQKINLPTMAGWQHYMSLRTLFGVGRQRAHKPAHNWGQSFERDGLDLGRVSRNQSEEDTGREKSATQASSSLGLRFVLLRVL